MLLHQFQSALETDFRYISAMILFHFRLFQAFKFQFKTFSVIFRPASNRLAFKDTLDEFHFRWLEKSVIEIKKRQKFGISNSFDFEPSQMKTLLVVLIFDEILDQFSDYS